MIFESGTLSFLTTLPTLPMTLPVTLPDSYGLWYEITLILGQIYMFYIVLHTYIRESSPVLIPYSIQ
jgi:hypothetical protein